jgi:ribosome recycling factor
MLNDIKQDAEERMHKSVDVLGANFNKIRTGRAHPSLLDGVTVNYYGNPTPLSQVANVSYWMPVPCRSVLGKGPWCQKLRRRS